MQLHRGNQNCESLFNATIFSNGQVISLWGNLLRSVPHIKFDVKTKFHRYLDHCVLSLLPSKLQELWPIVWVTEKPRAQEPWKDSHSHMQKCATIFEDGKAYGLSLAKKLIAASWRRSKAIREDIKSENTFSFGHCPKRGVGLPMPEFFGTFFTK